MEALHASKEPLFRYIPCERCKSLSRQEVIFKNLFFNSTSKENEVCYKTRCLNCSQVYRKDLVTETHTTTIEKWNDFVEKGIYPERKETA